MSWVRRVKLTAVAAWGLAMTACSVTPLSNLPALPPAPPPAPAMALHSNPQLTPQQVMIPSLDRDRAGKPVMLLGHWTPAVVKAGARDDSPRHDIEHRGAVLLLHGCSGPYEAGGRLSSRMREYTHRLNERGWSVLVLDSLTPRGERELCTQNVAARKVTQANRRLDAWAGLTWLAAQPGVDAARLGLIGWSNGGSTVLAALQADRFASRPASVPLPAFAVAYYPGCLDISKTRQGPAVPLLLQLGQEDDWTPPQPCQAWAQEVGRSAPSAWAPVDVVSYPGAYHGFDSEAPLRLRRDVPNGVNRGQGVHVGGDPVARRLSFERLNGWLARFERGV